MKIFSKINLFAAGVLLCLNFGCQSVTSIKSAACYSFDGDAMDDSGNLNNGVVKGATLTTDRFGNVNSAYLFDGKNSTITVDLKNAPSLDSNYSISWWYYIDSAPKFRETFDAQNMMVLVDRSKKIGMQFGFRGPGYKSIGLDTWQWGGRLLHEVKQPAIGKWHHCAYTFDGKKHSFYLNGKLASTSEVTAHVGAPKLLMLGNSPYGVRYFKGKLDDLRILKRTLTEAEVLELSQGG